MISIPTYDDIVVKTLSEVDTLLHDFVFNGYSALSSYLRGPLGLIATIYIIIFGCSIMMGWIQLSLSNFVKAILKISFIYMAVTEWSWVSQYFVEFINHVTGEIGDALLSASPIHIPGIDGLDGAMQITLTEFTDVGALIFKAGSLINLGGWLDGIILWAFGYAIVGLGLFELILAKVMLAILFIFTPLMTVFCFFKPLQRNFSYWLGCIVGFSLLQLFVTCAMTLALSLAYWWIDAHTADTALQIGNYGTLPIIIIGIICVGLVSKAARLAQEIGGMVYQSTFSTQAAMMLGGALKTSTLGLKTMRGVATAAFSTLGAAAHAGKQVVKAGYKGTRSVYKGARSVVRGLRQALRRGD